MDVRILDKKKIETKEIKRKGNEELREEFFLKKREFFSGKGEMNSM